MAVNLSFITLEEGSPIAMTHHAEKCDLVPVLSDSSRTLSSSSSFRLSSKRASHDGTIAKEKSSPSFDHSSTFPFFKDLALSERLKEASVISLVKKKHSSRRKPKLLSLETEELRFSDSSDSDSERRLSNVTRKDLKNNTTEDSLSPILHSPVKVLSVERRSSYVRTRRKSTPHLSTAIAEDSEFDISSCCRHFSLKQDRRTVTSQSRKTAGFSFSHQRKKSEGSLLFSGIPFINPLRSRDNKSVDDLSRCIDLSHEILPSVSLLPKSCRGTNAGSYRELARVKNNFNKTDPDSELSHRVPNPAPQTSNHTAGDVTKSGLLNKQKRRKSSLTRQKKLSLPILWRSEVNDMLTNYPYDVTFQDESKQVRVSGDMETSKIPRMKSFDAVVFDVLRVAPEAYARQLTLLDWSHFAAITPDEISSCGWTKKDKLKRSPKTSFWVIREILHASTTKTRVETLTLFIKIAKKLFELNNLHSLMAVVQSLNSSSIIRLTKTWNMLPKNHRATFDRLLSLVKENDNRAELRAHMEGIRLPCIPFLGMYLSDVIYIDSAHPDTGGLESQERANKLNNILRILSEFQQSKYDHLQDETHIKNYLTSVKYIEELQKFLEEENYKLSLKIEPVQVAAAALNGHARLEQTTERPDTSLCRHVSHTPPSQGKFIPGHRKTKSLGRESAFSGSVSFRSKPENPKTTKRQSWYNSRSKQRDSTVWYLSPVKGFSTENISSSGSLKLGTFPVPDVAITTSLLDDSIIATPTSHRTSITNGTNGSLGSSRSNSGSEFSEQDETSSSSDRTLDISSAEYQTCSFEGCLKRKCVLKYGKKPSMPSWSKYWVCICDSKLIYFSPKSFKGTNREDFKSRPCKAISILGWMILYSNDRSRLDCFQLNNPESGNMYRFQCESKEVALVWIANLEAATKGRPKPDHDLINLEDT